MAIVDLYSKRRKRAQDGHADVYRYDELPQPLRVQLFQVLTDALGSWARPSYSHPFRHAPNKWWTEIHDMVAREKGVFRLSQIGATPFDACAHYLLGCTTDDALDLIEFSFRYLDRIVRKWPNSYQLRELRLTAPDDAIAELNGRFQEHGVGYVYEYSQIQRIDSHYLHAETVRPALRLLQDGRGFEGPMEEFLAAHEYHRKGDQKEAIASALKAFESTMKAICDARRWDYDRDKDTANRLLKILFDRHLIPEYLQTHFAGLRSMLEAGVSTVRNRTSGHGQGAVPTDVPSCIAAYALHQTAANIVLLVEAHRGMPLAPPD
jgi:hypothetical protein